ncbi:heat shock 70 kDa protein 14-like [Homalodisca vitripennis]|uniref:heat shock 70 kDa protein 14-like n=1 Tax=Homalodisca vitripennis TaxID=197043 RepID=UPI001EEC9D17|nr:heat shock 70 kDa protein 14-like [Homalodisca vitripennis]
MNPVFGIHVGNSSACLAVCKQDDGKFSVEVIANDAGDRVMPAIVTVTENESVVGAACKSLMISRWSTTIKNNKMMLNREDPDFVGEGERKVATVLEDGELYYSLPLEDRVELKTPLAIASCIYRSLFEIAKSAVPGVEGEISCVLMVPKHFSESARFKIKTAAEAVGWDVLHIVNEPATAILGYNLLTGKVPPPPQKVLVYRVGGQTCEATVIDLTHGMITVLDTEHSDIVGGKALIKTLTSYLADAFYRRNRLDPQDSHRSFMKLTVAAEECIHVLSTIESANCFVDGLCEGVDLNHTVSRARFESLLFPFLQWFAQPIYTVLERLQMTPDSVSTVLLCGGILKVPRLKKSISDIFQESSTNVLPLPNGVNYDEVLACGAARQAGYIALDQLGDSFLSSEIVIPILKSPLTIQVEGAECESVELKAGQPLPLHRTMTLTSCSELVSIIAIQVESDNIMLRGQLDIRGVVDPTDLDLEIDSENGIRIGINESPETVRHLKIRMFASPSLL